MFKYCNNCHKLLIDSGPHCSEFYLQINSALLQVSNNKDECCVDLENLCFCSVKCFKVFLTEKIEQQRNYGE